MCNLNQIVNKYLKENGISNKFFSEYIGCEYTKCRHWLSNNSRKLDGEQIKKVHEFLSGKHLKSVDEII